MLRLSLVSPFPLFGAGPNCGVSPIPFSSPGGSARLCSGFPRQIDGSPAAPFSSYCPSPGSWIATLLCLAMSSTPIRKVSPRRMTGDPVPGSGSWAARHGSRSVSRGPTQLSFGTLSRKGSGPLRCTSVSSASGFAITFPLHVSGYRTFPQHFLKIK